VATTASENTSYSSGLFVFNTNIRAYIRFQQKQSCANNRFHQDYSSGLFVFNTNYSYRQLLSTRTFVYIHSHLTRPIVCRHSVPTRAIRTYYCFQTELFEVNNHYSAANITDTLIVTGYIWIFVYVFVIEVYSKSRYPVPVILANSGQIVHQVFA